MAAFFFEELLRFVGMIFHQIYDQENDKNPYFRKYLPMILDCCEIISWITLLLFVFEMQTIKNRLETETPSEF
jgi:hypothetical protein